MKTTFEYVMYKFAFEEMGKLSVYCHSIFLKIACHSFGHFTESAPITKENILKDIGFSDRAGRDAINTLQENGYIIISRGGGRGKKTSYEINLARYAMINKHGAQRGSLEGTVHGFEKHLELGQPADNKPHETATPPPDKPAGQGKSKKHKRSDEEHEVFDDIWKTFETAIGKKMTGKAAALEAKEIWYLIDTMNNGNGWKSDIKEMVSRFIRYQKDPPEGMEYLSKCPPLPHILTSARTWLRMTTDIPDDKPKAATLEETMDLVEKVKEKYGVNR